MQGNRIPEFSTSVNVTDCFHYDRLLLALLVVLLGVSCIGAPYPDDLVLQHVLTLIALAALVAAHRARPFTGLSLTLIHAFLLLHVLGARYLY